MTTSLAAMAASTSTSKPTPFQNQHHFVSSSSSPTLPTNSNNISTCNNQSTSSSPQIMDPTDSNYEIKTEFYTREGLWKVLKSQEYSRQTQINQYYQSNQLNNNSNSINSTNTITNNNNNYNNNNSNGNGNQTNDQVKLGIFKYSIETIYGTKNNDNTKSHIHNNNVCKGCNSKLKVDNYDENENLNEIVADDDDDVIFTKFNSSMNNKSLCILCKKKFETSNKNNTNCSKTSTSSNTSSPNSATPTNLDLIMFNYAREIYSYEFDSIKSKSKQDEPTHNLIDKKVYKTFMSTCFDINHLASKANTLVYQTKAPQLIKSSSKSVSSSPSSSSNNNALNLAPSYLSLIVAAGFSKGEIHVFDVFKKEASVFFNNSKLIDKSKVTCIKWLPNSINLFLASYSSGNMYLFDASQLQQVNVAPVYTKLIQNDSFSIFVNNNSNTSDLDKLKNSNSSNSLNLKLILTNNNNNNISQSPVQMNNDTNNNNNNQTNIQVAKNPLLKFSIGNSTAYFSNDTNSSYTSTDLNMVSFGINGVNEFAFSPCGSYLAVVSQDGLLRVFKFVYKSNQEMQIELNCSMKSYFGGLLCVTWSHDGKYIATGGEDDLITLFSFAEMRVVLRGRGHSSWINCVTFDPWTKLDNDSDDDDYDEDGDNYNNISIKSSSSTSSLRDYSASSNSSSIHEANENENNKQISNINYEFENNLKITAPKKRTISTLSDIKSNQNNNNRSSKHNKNRPYYRLASCGQDNQICFWDLTDDLLKEKPTQNNNVRRSRITSVNLPQITIDTKNNYNNDVASNNTSSNNAFSSNTISSISSSSSNSGTTRSLVSTAKNLFSTNSNNNKNKSEDLDDTKSTSSSGISSGLSTASSFFRRHKRNNTNSSINSTETNRPTKPNSSSKSKNNTNNTNNDQVTLNSYKKSSNSFLSNMTASIGGVVNNSTSSKTNDKSFSSNLSKKNSFNEPKKSNNNNNNDNNNFTMNRNTSSTLIQQEILLNSLPFNICPKLDQVPIIEPLICKRISNERLTSIIFKKDGFIVANQDGLIMTWARPSLNKHKLSNKNSQESKEEQLPQLLSPNKESNNNSCSNSKVNFTSL